MAQVADIATVPRAADKDSPPGIRVSLSDERTNPAAPEEIQPKPWRWHWLLAACVLALVAYMALAAWRRAKTVPPWVPLGIGSDALLDYWARNIRSRSCGVDGATCARFSRIVRSIRIPSRVFLCFDA